VVTSIVPIFACIPNIYGLVSISNQWGGVQSKLVWYPHHRFVLVREPHQTRILVRYPIPVGMVSTSHLYFGVGTTANINCGIQPKLVCNFNWHFGAASNSKSNGYHSIPLWGGIHSKPIFSMLQVNS
jgi:hypothetical protein